MLPVILVVCHFRPSFHGFVQFAVFGVADSEVKERRGSVVNGIWEIIKHFSVCLYGREAFVAKMQAPRLTQHGIGGGRRFRVLQ